MLKSGIGLVTNQSYVDVRCHFPQEAVDVAVKGLVGLSQDEAALGAGVVVQLQVRLMDTSTLRMTEGKPGVQSVNCQQKPCLTCPQRKRALVLAESISKALLPCLRALCGLSSRSSVTERFR